MIIVCLDASVSQPNRATRVASPNIRPFPASFPHHLCHTFFQQPHCMRVCVCVCVWVCPCGVFNLSACWITTTSPQTGGEGAYGMANRTKRATKHVSIHTPLCAKGGGPMGCGWLGTGRVMQYACNDTAKAPEETRNPTHTTPTSLPLG